MSTLNLANHPTCPTLKKIWNREYAAQRLAMELERLDGDISYRFSVLLVEMAGFSRRFASRLGYATSTDTLRKVLNFLTGDLGPEGICAHLGGDEFLLILPGTPAEKANVFADLLRRNWAGQDSPETGSLEIAVAGAVSIAKGDTVRTLFTVLDQAIDQEKHRNRVQAPRQTDASMVHAVSPQSRPAFAGNS